MTIDQLRQMHHAQPFRPFRIHLADGRDLDVEHPDFLAYTPTGRTVVLTRLDETFEVIDLLIVTTLEAIDGKPRGRTKRRRG